MERKRNLRVFLIMLVLLCNSACGRGSSHCYLHEGFAHDAPCLVNLATGEIAELSVAGDAGHISWSMIDGAVVQQMPEERTVVSISNAPQNVNAGLFCADCLALISEVPNSGYILADLHDLSDIRLYAIEDSMSLALLDHQVSAAYDFIVTHRLAGGSVETLTPTESADGLKVTVHSLSPFAVDYKEAPKAADNGETQTANTSGGAKPNNDSGGAAKTGDESELGL